MRAQTGAPQDIAHSTHLLERYKDIRSFSNHLCRLLNAEDQVVQSMPDASPAKWHLAHTTWFFEQFLLVPHEPGYRVHHPDFAFLFNSYYNSVGERHCRPRRGMITRPDLGEVHAYRASVDSAMEEFLSGIGEEKFREIAPVFEIGLHHEQQHQELILTDLKHLLSMNPLHPVYAPAPEQKATAPVPADWISFDGGIVGLGHQGDGFCYDNETPRHDVLLRPYALSRRPVTSGEYLAFIEDGGYTNPLLWLSDGWAAIQAEGWDAPLYWFRGDGGWRQFTLAGERPVDPEEPVTHVSYYEADAFARWAGARLPLEAEWEHAVATLPIDGRFVEDAHYHPVPAAATRDGLLQMYGDVWEWTASPYTPYPGYAPAPGAIGEYNGKFMCNQFVLRGGSCATSRTHIRPSYRNFFHPPSRWQFTGLRLAKDL